MPLSDDKKFQIRDIIPNGHAHPLDAPKKSTIQAVKRISGFLTRRSETVSPPENDAEELEVVAPRAPRLALKRDALRPIGPRLAWRAAFKPFPWKVALAGVVVVAGVAGAGVLISKAASAVVTIVPRSEKAVVDAVIAVGGAGIAGETASAEESVSAHGKATGIQDISERASGRITIYNAYGAESQQLVRRTRFQTSDGKIFRLDATTVVPAAVMKNGKLEPSSVDVGVTADQAGDSYNIALVDFTIPGFKGTAKQDKFYARSKTAMAGGFIGKAAVIREEDVAVLREALKKELADKLNAKIASRLPAGFMVAAGAARMDISASSSEPAVGKRGDAFELRMSGKLTALAVKHADIEAKLAEKYGKTASGGSAPVIRNFEALVFRADKIDFEKRAMALGVTGDAQFVWTVPADALKKGLVAAGGTAGRSAVFASYPQIRQAAVVYHPSWWKIFPRSPDKITVEEAENSN